MSRFKVIGLLSPGKVNVFVQGAFRDVELFNTTDEVLEELYNKQCPYVELSPEEFMARNPDAQTIKIEKINLSKKKISSPE